jgi:pimeloyl-ACP methyl ester carboxylesterase
MELSMGLSATLSRSRVIRRASTAAFEAIDADSSDTASWGMRQFRSSSPWAVGQAVASLGRHHSTRWLSQVDVPTAVVVTTKDRVIPPDRQRDISARIPGATVHEAACGHAGCVLEHQVFVPALLDAAQSVSTRMRERQPA